MILSRSNVVHYLLEQGLLTLDAVVDGELMVIDATRRNRNFKVMRRGQAGLLRQADPALGCPRPSRPSAPRRPATGWRATMPEFSTLAELVPRDFLYDNIVTCWWQ